MARKNPKEVGLVEWVEVGERLKAVDPRNFVELLELADQLALAHENPMAPELKHIGNAPTISIDDEMSRDFD